MSDTADSRRWQSEFTDAQHNQLANVRASASTWSGGIAALLGVFATASVIVVPASLNELHHGWVRWTVLGLALIAGASGIIALWKASSAAAGAPKLDALADFYEYESDVRAGAVTASRQLRTSREWLKIAIIALVVAALLSQLDGVLSSQGPNYVLVTTPGSTSSVCGPLVTDKHGTAMVGTVQIPDGSAITVVPHC